MEEKVEQGNLLLDQVEVWSVKVLRIQSGIDLVDPHLDQQLGFDLRSEIAQHFPPFDDLDQIFHDHLRLVVFKHPPSLWEIFLNLQDGDRIDALESLSNDLGAFCQMLDYPVFRLQDVVHPPPVFVQQSFERHLHQILLICKFEVDGLLGNPSLAGDVLHRHSPDP